MPGNFIVKQFQPPDWEQFKAIRLEALRTEPGVYCSSYHVESERSDAHWKERLERKDVAYFGLYDGATLVGMAGITPDTGPKQYELIAAYIQPAHRGKGLSRLLYEARIEWARANGVKKLIISHRESNIASKAANQHFGFQHTYTEKDRLWHDGAREDNLYYELEL